MVSNLRRRALPLLALSMLVAACSSGDHQRLLPRGTLQVTTASGTVTLNVEVAGNGRARTIGLMNRPRLAPDAGMVFLFTRPVSSSFWMKDTLIPLSIAFWDGSGRILRILDMEPCRADPCPFYSPDVTYVGAVEANVGWFTDHGVRPGDRVALSDD
ncbi:MAG: DUF192 domain-containing protein [Actinomycetota bacterium]